MSKETDQKLHRDQDLNRGPLLIFLIEDAWKQWGNELGPPQKTSAYIPYQSLWNQWGHEPTAPHRTSAYILYKQCIKSVRRYNRSSTEDFYVQPLSKVYEPSRERNQDFHRGLLFVFLFKRYGIRENQLLLTSPIQMQELRKEIDQELHRELLLILFIKSVWNQ